MSKNRLLLPALVLLAAHLGLWLYTSTHGGHRFSRLITHWDSSWYSRIIRYDYTPKSLAFYPLYPALVKSLCLTPDSLRNPAPQGVVFSTVCFILFCLFASGILGAKSFPRAGPDAEAFFPLSLWPWLFFLLQPGSYIFHSHHTESLFLLLSWYSLLCASRGFFLSASLFAGLCALTRNQGILVAFCAALLLAQNLPARRALPRFVFSGLISAAFFSLFPLYQYFAFGQADIFLQNQQNWFDHPVCTPAVYLKTFLMANDWQTRDFSGFLHQATALLLGIGAWRLWRRNHRVLALYTALSLALMPLQGDFHNVFRFGAVLFPAWYALGREAETFPPWIRGLIFATLLFVNLRQTFIYAWTGWAY